MSPGLADDLLQGTECDELVLFDIGHPRLGDGVVGERIGAEHDPAPLVGDEFGEAVAQSRAQVARDRSEGIDERQPRRAARPGRGQDEAGTVDRFEIRDPAAQDLRTQTECCQCSGLRRCRCRLPRSGIGFTQVLLHPAAHTRTTRPDPVGKRGGGATWGRLAADSTTAVVLSGLPMSPSIVPARRRPRSISRPSSCSPARDNSSFNCV